METLIKAKQNVTNAYIILQTVYKNILGTKRSYDDTPLELVENAKYLSMIINCDISWSSVCGVFV